ncbi:hypothetical protein CPter91_4736 [Collimonas pratensis]|uniref:Uncharacterized protein n=2 Tax=Collimonas pratensis TaxID=279113 RepID=A0A127QB05_9BURK|nr:hypothetical protein CPter91_4736 [Collimonas pratensis]
MNVEMTEKMHRQVTVAFEKIIASGKQQILTWNGEKIVVTPIDGKRAPKLFEQSNCLGVYDVDSTSEQILIDLFVVIEKKD